MTMRPSAGTMVPCRNRQHELVAIFSVVAGPHLLDLQNITGDDLGSIDLAQSTVTEDHSLQGEGLL